jgi:serine/threonine protein kinase
MTGQNTAHSLLEDKVRYLGEREKMTPERREPVSPDKVGDLEIPETGDLRIGDHTPPAVAATPSVSAPPEPAPAPPAAFGRYQMRRALGAGGFGSVYVSHDTQLDRPVAIKVLRSGSAQLQFMSHQ